MRKVPLGDIAEISIGRTPSRGDASYWGPGLPWLTIADMNQGRLLKHSKEQVTERAISSGLAKVVPVGTVLMSFKLTIGRVGITTVPLATNEAIAAFTPFVPAEAHTPFLAHALQWAAKSVTADRAAMGLTLNKQKLAKLLVPWPSIDEQRRISDILDLSAGLERRHGASTDLLAELESTLVLDHTKSELSQPIQLSDLGRISTGKTPPTSDDSNFGGRIPFVTPGDLGTNHAPSRHLSESGASQARLVRSGSTLVCCIGATIGKVGVASETSAFNQQINAIEWDEEFVDDIYGMLAMRGLAKVIAARGTSTTLPIINKTDFSALTLQLPALSVQRQVAAKWKCISNLRAQHDRAVAELRLQQASLADRAFKGEL